MARIGALIWNIQTFGQPSGFDKDKYGYAMADFISLFVKRVQVYSGCSLNVIIIQEFRKAGPDFLHALIVFLRTTTGCEWGFDWIPAAFDDCALNPAGPPGTLKPNLDFGDVEFLKGANSEGYAVLYKIGGLVKFLPGYSAKSNATQHNTRAQQHGFIKLCSEGVPPAFNLAGTPPLFPDPAAPAGTIVTAGFPSTSVTVSAASTVNTLLGVTKVRRPCTVIMDTSSGPVHLIAYHAPVEVDWGSLLGACACALLRQVHDPVGYPNVIVGGDFNVIRSNQDDGFANFIAAGMACGTLVNPANPIGSNNLQSSVVHYTSGGLAKPILLSSASPPADFRGQSRDQVFYRLSAPITNVDSMVYDVLDDLVNDHVFSVNVARSKAIKRFVEDSLENDLLPGPLRGKTPAAISARQDLLNIFTNTSPFPNRFVAAMFYRIFISDHSPLFICFDA